MASLGKVSLVANGGAACAHDEAPLKTRARARRGPWGTRKGLGEFGAT
jgi:hypothetical protein